MADIFISYAHENQETAKTLAQAFADQGWSVWWDRHIPSGRRFQDVIERELTAARCVIALWSTAALGSPWVREEAQDGLDRDILVPARIEMVRLPIGFRTIQTADLIGWEGNQAHPGFAQLIEDITAVLGEFPKQQALEPEAKPEKPTARRAEPQAKKPIELRDLPDLAVFRDIDAPWFPEMVVLPTGEFLMGSPDSDTEGHNGERPQHRVTIGRRFAIGRYTVTFGEYRHFVEATGQRHDSGIYVFAGSGWKQDSNKSWRHPGFEQTDRYPVVGVSWHDAVAYCDWLAKETRNHYRLPSEAEWEYACRAGTTTRYAFGDMITPKDANYADSKLGKPAEVGTYAPNPWRLYDMHGNVWEWVEDIWHGSYEGAPTNGSAWTDGEHYSSGDRGDRGNRGGSWNYYPRFLRSANRNWNQPKVRIINLGFRVARMLE